MDVTATQTKGSGCGKSTHIHSQGSNIMGEIVTSMLMTVILYAFMIVAYKKGW